MSTVLADAVFALCGVDRTAGVKVGYGSEIISVWWISLWGGPVSQILLLVVHCL